MTQKRGSNPPVFLSITRALQYPFAKCYKPLMDKYEVKNMLDTIKVSILVILALYAIGVVGRQVHERLSDALTKGLSEIMTSPPEEGGE